MDIFFNICEPTACHLPKTYNCYKKTSRAAWPLRDVLFLYKRFMRYSSIIDITTFTTSSVLGLEK